MLKTTLRGFLLVAVFLMTQSVFAQESEEKVGVDMTEVIMHHIKDAHDFHIIDIKDEEGNYKPVSIPLPVILIDNGLQVFSSKRLYHEGEAKTVELADSTIESYLANEELGYGLYHGKIYKLNEAGALDFAEAGVVSNTRPLDFSITKNVFTLLFTALIMALIMFATVKSYGKEAGAPKGIAKFFEPIVVFVRDDIARVNIGEASYQKFMPYLLTAFFFIWLGNMLGLVPFFPGGANLTGNISFTLTLALFTLIFTLFSGKRNYWKHIFAMPGVPWPLLVIMIPVEIIGVIAKPFALTVRLFANMTAGHIILLSLTGIIFTFGNAGWAGLSIPMSLFIYVLKLLVAFLQAFIFTMLSALFIGEAVAVEHD